MSTYPILNQNTPIGTLETVPDRLYTVFTARCEPIAPRLRLAVFGGGQSAYLGLMLPEDGTLFLRRRLSRLERGKLPRPILFAAEESWQPREEPAPPEETDWRPAPDGTLRRVERGTELVAVPAERVHAPGLPRSLLRVIGGREYLVFPM